MDELRRINGSLGHGESTLTESEEATVLERTKALKVSSKVNMHKVLELITSEKWGTPVLVMRAILCPTELFGTSRPSSTSLWKCGVKENMYHCI